MPLSDNQLKALQILSKRGTYHEAAIAAKVSRRTVIRWMKISEFQEQLSSFVQARIKVTSEVIERQEQLQIEDLVPKALARVRRILDDPDARPNDQLRASELVGRWASLGHVQTTETSPPQETLRGYIDYLAFTNRNENGKSNSTTANLN